MKNVEEEAALHHKNLLMDQLEALITRIMGIHADIPCLEERLELSNLLQKLYEIHGGPTRPNIPLNT